MYLTAVLMQLPDHESRLGEVMPLPHTVALRKSSVEETMALWPHCDF